VVEVQGSKLQERGEGVCRYRGGEGWQEVVGKGDEGVMMG